MSDHRRPYELANSIKAIADLATHDGRICHADVGEGAWMAVHLMAIELESILGETMCEASFQAVTAPAATTKRTTNRRT